MVKGPGIPKGTRDFGPYEMVRRNYIFDTVRSVFSLYGYRPLETPAMENLSTLLGKYGDEGDRLLFKILNSGDFRSGISDEDLVNSGPAGLSSRIAEKGLRYDLTVPFARYVAQNRNGISFPFKRYQIQPVWRADKPQKGRYREFYQCDVDVIGDDSIYNEYELLKIIDDIFTKLRVRCVIKLNNRKILSGIATRIGQGDKMGAITVAIDKLDKIGIENVNRELIGKGLPGSSVEQLQPILFLQGTAEKKLNELEKLLNQEEGLNGIKEIKTLLEYIDNDHFNSAIEFDLTLARGLDYYTGAIIEVKAIDVEIGSICGGGRYDDLTGIFGMEGVSGVGVSFGADRIYDVMNHLDLFPDNPEQDIRVLFLNFGKEEEKHSIHLLNKLREAGIASELYPSAVKMKKQMSYANSRGVLLVAMAGEDEIRNKEVTVRNMKTGKQATVNSEELIDYIKESI